LCPKVHFKLHYFVIQKKILKSSAMAANLPIWGQEPLHLMTMWADYIGEAGEEWLAEDGKSGLTPLRYFHNLPYSPSLEEWKQREMIEIYQKYCFEGFTTRQLIQAGAAAVGGNWRMSDLTEIHDVFSRDKWDTSLPEHLAFFPLGQEREGYWRADNDDVWRILEPCFALATKFIVNSYCWPW
jgi:hypothetical protein